VALTPRLGWVRGVAVCGRREERREVGVDDDRGRAVILDLDRREDQPRERVALLLVRRRPGRRQVAQEGRGLGEQIRPVRGALEAGQLALDLGALLAVLDLGLVAPLVRSPDPLEAAG
jgi:hypothetical protein